MAERVKTQWMQRAFDDAVVGQLQQALQCSPLLARVLAARGIHDAEYAGRYLNPQLAHLGDPARIADIDVAVERIVCALEGGETIGIFGDYDVDGVTSTTLLWDFLEACGAQVAAHIPNRIIEGYGLSIAGVRKLHNAGATLIITVDCGVTAHEEVDAAAELGIDVIVVDHHTVPVNLPNAVAVLNPHRPDCASDAKHLCAVGVTFNLCLALRKSLRDDGAFARRPEPNMRDFLDVVALGTVADVMPLERDNRVLVHHGLQVLAQRRRIGMNALLDIAGVDAEKATAGSFGFHLGPRINAAGRLEDAMAAVRLLRATSSTVANEIAKTLNEQNLSRRQIEQDILAEAIDEVENSTQHDAARVLVVARHTWHPGVVGIVASRLVERFGKPTVVIGAGGKGSGRSIPAFHLHEALVAVAPTLLGFGGHAHAVGVHVDLQRVDDFSEALRAHAQHTLRDDDLVRQVLHDGELSVNDISANWVRDLEQCEPFGRGNPEPVFLMRGLQFNDVRVLKEKHVRANLAQRPEVSMIAFGMAERLDALQGPVDALVKIGINEWQGKKTLQLSVVDLEMKN